MGPDGVLGTKLLPRVVTLVFNPVLPRGAEVEVLQLHGLVFLRQATDFSKLVESPLRPLGMSFKQPPEGSGDSEGGRDQNNAGDNLKGCTHATDELTGQNVENGVLSHTSAQPWRCF